MKEVEKFLTNFLKQKKAKILLLALVFIFLFILPQVSLLIIFGYFSFLSYIKHKNFMIDFAKENSLSFSESMDANLFSGRIFSYGHSKSVRNVLRGKYGEDPIKIFNYSYRTGSGKNSSNHDFTVLEVEIKNTQFPFILLKPKSMIKSFWSKDSKISLEKEYAEKFDLYCEEDYEIEVLQIFTKELLDYLIKHGNKFSIEFSGNKIYFHDDLKIKKKKQLLPSK